MQPHPALVRQMLDIQSISRHISRSQSLLCVRLVIAMVVLFHVGLAQAASMSLSHQSAHILDHGQEFLAADAGEDHGHYHDEGVSGSSFDAEHHHNPLDHSHDKLNLPPMTVGIGASTPKAWISGPPLLHYAGPYASFERPPKSPSAT
jgi:hypothetical protein